MARTGREHGHRQVDHTADLALELWAPDEETLLQEGARAVVGLVTEGAEVEPLETRRVELESVDREDRLVRWMNEVLWLAIGEGFLVADARIVLSEKGVTAEVWGEPDAADRIRTELKSVTYHDLHVERDGAGVYRARVVIDV